MKAINGKLDMSKTYKLVDIAYGDCLELSGAICENCGHIITNIATVERQDGLRYGIGLDCMNTIVNMPASDKQQAKNELNRIKRFVQGIKYSQIIIIGNNDIFCFYHYGTDTNWYYEGYGKYTKYQYVINKADCRRLQIDLALKNMRDIPRLLKFGTDTEITEQCITLNKGC